MEDKIEVGEYVRTVKGYIVKIDKEKKNLQMLKFLDVEYGNIIIHSINIIDILKIGDFIYTEYGWGWYHHKVNEETIVIDDGAEFIDVNKDEIHRILTREMLWDNSYELKE